MVGTDFDSRPYLTSGSKAGAWPRHGSRLRVNSAGPRGAHSLGGAGSGDGGTRQEEGLRRVPEAAERVGVLLAHPSDQGDDAVVLIDHLASAAAGQADGSPVLGGQLVVCLVLAALAELPEVLIVVRHLVVGHRWSWGVRGGVYGQTERGRTCPRTVARSRGRRASLGYTRRGGLQSRSGEVCIETGRRRCSDHTPAAPHRFGIGLAGTPAPVLKHADELQRVASETFGWTELHP